MLAASASVIVATDCGGVIVKALLEADGSAVAVGMVVLKSSLLSSAEWCDLLATKPEFELAIGREARPRLNPSFVTESVQRSSTFIPAFLTGKRPRPTIS
jgi:hypothetical protein